MRLVTLQCKFGTQRLTSLHSVSFPELVCKISPTFSRLSELRDFFHDWQHWLFVWRTYQMHALFLSRRNSYALLSCSSSCLFHELAFWWPSELSYFVIESWSDVRQRSSVVWPQVNWSRVVDENCTNLCFVSRSWVQHIFKINVFWTKTTFLWLTCIVTIQIVLPGGTYNIKMPSLSEGRRNSNALPSSSHLALFPRSKYQAPGNEATLYLAVLPTLWMLVFASSGQLSCTTQWTAGKSNPRVAIMSVQSKIAALFLQINSRFPCIFFIVSHRESWAGYQGKVSEVLHRCILPACSLT